MKHKSFNMHYPSLRNLTLVSLSFALFFISSLQCTGPEKQPESAAYKRFKELDQRFEPFNEFYSEFKFSDVNGIGFEKGVIRRDPTGVIKVGDLYYVWYTRPAEVPVVGFGNGNDTLRSFPWDLAEIWCATSPDGYNWIEKGPAVTRGPKGNFDARTVFTPDVLVAKGRYYLFYQAVGSLEQAFQWRRNSTGGDFRKNVIGMSWSDSPDGPWQRWEVPILEAGDDTSWEADVVHDPTFIVRGGKYWLYYKSTPNNPGFTPEGEISPKKWRDMRMGWGVAIADKPEGPYIKSEFNPVICGGHETILWPYRNGVCAMLKQGPEKGSIQFAEDGLNFYPMAHGISVPAAAGVFRVGNFTDTEIEQGQGITWGIFHNRGYLMRFDCDLSLESGKRKHEGYKEYMNWKTGEKMNWTRK